MKMAEVLIRYPGLKGYILKACNLQNLLTSNFDVSIELEEQIDDRLTLVLNKETIYTEPVKKHSQIDLDAIIAEVSVYLSPLEKPVVSAGGGKEENDPEHKAWMNSVCSGE